MARRHEKDLPTIALLGATGKAGKETLRILLARQCYRELRIYARSSSKLIELFPDVQKISRVRICVGSISDRKNMKECLDGADIIISTLGSNDFYASSVLRESAKAIIETLDALHRPEAQAGIPRLIWLSSASWNPRFSSERPRVVDWLIKSAFQVPYFDLRTAEQMLLEVPHLCSMLRVQPGVLVEEEGTGCEISTESIRLAASYPDLGEAFVELAVQREYDSLDQVGVSSAGGDRVLRYAPIIVSRLSGGLFSQYFPGAYWINRVIS